MTDAKADAGAVATAPKATQPSNQRLGDTGIPDRPKAVSAEDLGLEVEEPKVEDGELTWPEANPEPKRGFVQDKLGRQHEVEDVDAYLASYPGSRSVKAGDVTKAKLGHKPAAVEVADDDAGQSAA